MTYRGDNFKQVELNVVGSSTFGRYPKISIEKTYNFYVSDDFLVPYVGYQTVIPASAFGPTAKQGRGCYSSTVLNRIVIVVDNKVFETTIYFNPQNNMYVYSGPIQIGGLVTFTGPVYFAENNAGEILISDNVGLYSYIPTNSMPFMQVPIDFTPGYITFHDTYFISPISNTHEWELSAQNDGRTWPGGNNIGALLTKPDNTQACVRMPSKGNMILVMGENVTEGWFDTGYQLFPYTRATQMSLDYGCLSPATIAYLGNYVVWLGTNEQTGPIIMYTDGGEVQTISTDGINFLLSSLNNPSDSAAFIFRQAGHIIYHINFYTDNLSLFYDFNTQKFYHACDQNLNYYIADNICFFNNQYYFTSRNNANFYAFGTMYYTYDGVEIPRMRICKNVRFPNQDYFIANDVGFTIEQGVIPFQQEPNVGEYLIAQDNDFFVTQTDGYFLVTQQAGVNNILPAVDLSISTDGGYSFTSDYRYILNPPGYRKNRLLWWNLGAVNDLVCQFKFWGLGRFTATDGIVNIRTM